MGEESAAPVDSIQLDPAQVVGLASGEVEYLFGAISAVAGDDQRRIYVGDRTGGTVRAFDGNGRFLAWIARSGGGPGEIANFAASLVVGPGPRLHVRDGSRVTVFAPRGANSIPDSVAALWSIPGGGNLITSYRSGLSSDGRYFYPFGFFAPNAHPRYFHLSYRNGAPEADTLEVPPYPGLTGTRPALLRLGTDAMMLVGLSRVPFSAVPSWDVTPAGTLISTDGASSILVETDVNGDTVRVIQLSGGSRQPIPAQEKRDSLQALEERIARIPGNLNQATGIGEGVRERNLPNHPPEVIGLVVAQDGSIWVERWPPDGDHDSRYYDVFDSEGRLAKVVVLRAAILRDPPPWIGTNSVVGVLRDAETGVERVARFDLP